MYDLAGLAVAAGCFAFAFFLIWALGKIWCRPATWSVSWSRCSSSSTSCTRCCAARTS